MLVGPATLKQAGVTATQHGTGLPVNVVAVLLVKVTSKSSQRNAVDKVSHLCICMAEPAYPHWRSNSREPAGECVPERAGQNSICSCHSNFHGLDCSLMQCPNSTRGFICDNPLLDTPQRVSVTPQSGHQCDWAAGHCKCVGDFFGPDCTWKKCPKVDGRVCNGQGVCYSATHYTSLGSSTGYGPRSEGNFTDTEGKKHNFAPTFTDRTTQSAVAGQLPDGQSGNTDRSGWQSGQKYGVCSCRWPFYGVDCALRMCPNSTNAGSGTGLICDGHGACDHTTGFCTCEPGIWHVTVTNFLDAMPLTSCWFRPLR